MATTLGATAPTALVLQPLNTNMSFRDQAYAALKQAIVDADIYSHGEVRLDERQLSLSLGVSRTPIREAMTLSSRRACAPFAPRIFIVRKTKKQIVEMIEMWAALESMAARLYGQRERRGKTASARCSTNSATRRRPSTSTNTPTPISRSIRRSSGCRGRISWARRSRICSSTFARSAG